MIILRGEGEAQMAIVGKRGAHSELFMFNYLFNIVAHAALFMLSHLFNFGHGLILGGEYNVWSLIKNS